jgi:hypothetical protein
MVSPPFATFSAASKPAVVDTLKTVFELVDGGEAAPAPAAAVGVVPSVETRLEATASNTAAEDTVEAVPAVAAVGTVDAAPEVEVILEIVKIFTPLLKIIDRPENDNVRIT